MATTVHSYRPDLLRACASLTGPASYSTGGFAHGVAEAAGYGSHIAEVNAHVNVRSTTYGAYYDKSTGKIVAFVRATGAEVTGATDLSSVVFEITIFLDRS